MPNLAEYREQQDGAVKAVLALRADVDAANDGAGRDYSDEDCAKLDELKKTVDRCNTNIESIECVDRLTKVVRKTDPTPPGDPMNLPERPDVADSPVRKVPATARRRLQAIEARIGALSEFETESVRQVLLHVITKSPRAAKWCQDNNLTNEHRLHEEGVLTTGGYLVPDQVTNILIRLLETFGVARSLTTVMGMTSDHMLVRRRTGGLTAFAVGEGDAGTESTMAFDRIELVPRKWMVLSTVTSELGEDSDISIFDNLMFEIGFALANKEDDSFFNGDGTSTFHGIVGVRQRLLSLDSTRANIAGLVIMAGNQYADATLAEFNSVVAKLPVYATQGSVWVCSKFFFGTVMQRLEYAAGGNAVGDLAAGTGLTFLGTPVVISQIMPKVEANDQVCCLLGNFRLGSIMGDRRAITIATSTDATIGSTSMFETDEIAVKATQRYDMNIHDVGNASGTAADRVEGPIVGLLTAAA